MHQRSLDAIVLALLALGLGFTAGALVYLLPDGYEGPETQRTDMTDRPVDQ